MQPLTDSNRELRDLASKIKLENQRKLSVSNYEANRRKIENLRSEINDGQQNSRRTSLRIFKLKILENILSERDLTNHVVSLINNSVLKLKPDTSEKRRW